MMTYLNTSTHTQHRHALTDTHRQPRLHAVSQEAGVAVDQQAGRLWMSDGLAADLGHILQASGASAELDVGALPLSAALQDSYSRDVAEAYALTGGDDYQLCFTVPQSRCEIVNQWIDAGDFDATMVGQILAPDNSKNLVIVDGSASADIKRGFDHFSQ